MSRAPVLSKGQITIPKEVRDELNLETGDILIFQPSVHKDVSIKKGNINDKILDGKAPITQKGQVTIPKEIRDKLGLETGDILIFGSLNSTIYFRKQGEIVPCPVCNGIGSFQDYKLPCFVCDQTKFIEKNEKGLLFLLFFKVPFMKYKVGNAIIQQEFNENGIFEYTLFPKINLRSSVYPRELLDKIQDTLQMILLEEHIPKSTSDSTKFMIPSDNLLMKILDFFVTEEAKETVKTWFRYDKTI